MQHRLWGLRGKAYVREYKRLYEELCPEILAEFQKLYLESENKFTPKNLGAMAVKFQLPLTVLSDFLEGYELLPTGTWDRLKDRGCKAKDIGVEWK